MTAPQMSQTTCSSIVSTTNVEAKDALSSPRVSVLPALPGQPVLPELQELLELLGDENNVLKTSDMENEV